MRTLQGQGKHRSGRGDGYTHVGRASGRTEARQLGEDANLGCRDYCEKHRLEECDYNMRVHMLDRAKKLAGIEEAER